jgi:hypothetical protein
MSLRHCEKRIGPVFSLGPKPHVLAGNGQRCAGDTPAARALTLLVSQRTHRSSA